MGNEQVNDRIFQFPFGRRLQWRKTEIGPPEHRLRSVERQLKILEASEGFPRRIGGKCPQRLGLTSATARHHDVRQT